MTVAELIEALKAMPQDMLVAAPGYEDGWDDVISVSTHAVVMNAGRSWYNGTHQDAGHAGPATGTIVRLSTSREDDED